MEILINSEGPKGRDGFAREDGECLCWEIADEQKDDASYHRVAVHRNSPEHPKQRNTNAELGQGNDRRIDAGHEVAQFDDKL